jgi:hypothetical protein
MHLSAALLAPTPTTELPEPPTGRSARRAPRKTLQLDTFTNSASPGVKLVTVRDISTGGLLIEGPPGALSCHDDLSVELPEVGQVGARVVWQSGSFSGCEFTVAIPASAVSAALLKGKPAHSGRTEATAQATGATTGASGFEPELNFTAALSISIALWAVLVAAVFIVAKLA